VRHPMRCRDLSELPPPKPGNTGWPWTWESPPLPECTPDGPPWPHITIVTPSYNQAEFIEETIRSVLLQGYPDLEYIIMDGGSTDGTVDIIRRYEPWLSCVHTRPDGGQAAALAQGFRQATGQILAWLNSDDRYRPGTFARVARFFSGRPRVVFGCGDVNYVDRQGNLVERIWAVRPTHLLTTNLGVYCWPQQGCFWRRRAYYRAGGVDSSLRFAMDVDLFIRLSASGPSRRIPGAPLADFRIHGGAKSSTIPQVAKREIEGLVKKYSNPRIRSKEQLLRILWWFWYQPVFVRRQLSRYFGWEV
jgi:glycosyltransferase involved in cell wall biosynthesis